MDAAQRETSTATSAATSKAKATAGAGVDVATLLFDVAVRNTVDTHDAQNVAVAVTVAPHQ